MDNLPDAASPGAVVVPRVVVLPPALALLRRLREAHGPLLLHQSGGCCDGSVPYCFPVGGLLIGDHDVLLGVLDLRLEVGEVPSSAPEGADAVPVWIAGAQFPAWRYSRLIIDAVAGPGAGFSLDETVGEHLLTRSRIFADAEVAPLDAVEPVRGLAYERGTRPPLPTFPLVVATVAADSG